ncbi:uncharacterized protein DMENIID0001_144310 [Sergentomyia squamirostris]
MHFWIDKRSQACGFGRARVAASLSGTGLGYHPRRPRGKSMVTPVHRFPSIPPPQNVAPRTQQRHGNHNQNYHHHSQQQQQDIVVPQAQVINDTNCHLSVLPQIYSSGPSHEIDLEHGSLGIGAQAEANGGSQLLSLSTDGRPATESQLLPAHLKCGMWASLALATVFVAGAKFYFDHQGNGLEVLIFCAFSATFFLAACTVSLCRRSQDIHFPPVTPSVASADHVVVNTTVESPQIIHQVSDTLCFSFRVSFQTYDKVKVIIFYH